MFIVALGRKVLASFASALATQARGTVQYRLHLLIAARSG